MVEKKKKRERGEGTSMCQKFLWGGFVHEMGFLKASEGPKYTQENKCRGD
jgi:hypothetical protein